jgi:hypothetical protein
MSFETLDLPRAMESLRYAYSSSRTHDPRTWVVTTGRSYSDGDSVEVFVRPSADGTRVAVSDGGASFARRGLYGLSSPTSGAASLWAEILSDFEVEAEAGRIFTRGPLDQLPGLVALIADVSLVLDSVRLLAEGERQTFSTKLVHWLRQEPGTTVSTRSSVEDRYGTNQKVTAVVESRGKEILIQGAGGRTSSDLKNSAKHAAWVFGGLDERQWPMESRLLVFERVPTHTAHQRLNAQLLISRLGEVAYVGSFDAQLAVSRFLAEGAPDSTNMVTDIYGQVRGDL